MREIRIRQNNKDPSGSGSAILIKSIIDMTDVNQSHHWYPSPMAITAFIVKAYHEHPSRTETKAITDVVTVILTGHHRHTRHFRNPPIKDITNITVIRDTSLTVRTVGRIRNCLKSWIRNKQMWTRKITKRICFNLFLVRALIRNWPVYRELEPWFYLQIVTPNLPAFSIAVSSTINMFLD